MTAAEAQTMTLAFVSYGTVSTPVGHFILVRKDNDACAIKFTSFRRGDYKERTWWNAGGYSYYAKYDWFYQSDGSGDFTKPNVRSGHGKLDEHPLVGPTFHLSGQTGTTFVKCGSMGGLLWRYPDGIAFNMTFRSEGDNGYEMAPTRWKVPAQINIHNPRLAWYKFDHEYERQMTISLSELCCE